MFLSLFMTGVKVGQRCYNQTMNPKLAQKYLDKTRQDYEIIAKDFSVTRFEPWPEMRDLADKYVKEGDSVIDVGSGNGRLYQVFANRRVNYLGVEPSEPLIKLAKEKFPAAKFEVGDALNLSKYNEHKFDSGFLIAVLHHIPSYELRLKALKQVYSVLKPGGYLIMENWNWLQPRYFKRWLQKYLIDPSLPFNDLLVPWKRGQSKVIWRYYHAFTPRELNKLIQQAGFQPIEQYYVRRGEKSNRWKGYNIVTVARKMIS